MVEERQVCEKYGVESIRCRWLPGDEGKARSAEVIRLVQVLDWWYADASPSMANMDWQPGVLWKVKEFLNREATAARLVVTPAGMVTTDMATRPRLGAEGLDAWLNEPSGGFRKALQELEQLGCLGRDMLLGMDGCQAKTNVLQTVVHVSGEPRASLRNTTTKLYPAGDEKKYLIGWQICRGDEGVPEELAMARRIETAAGPVLVLVCFDVRLLRGPHTDSISHGGKIAKEIQAHFWEMATGEPRPRYAVVASHCHRQKHRRNPRSGTPGFIRAAEYLADRLGQTTIITTMFAPQPDLVALARDSFPVLGYEPYTVATLLVEDLAN